jgi:hypothetical protein
MYMNSPIQFKLAYRAITSDLLKLCEYVDPCQANALAFSHRTFELFLRTCTELENLWKYVLRDNNHPGPEPKWDIYSYQEVERSYGQALSNKEVIFVYWKPDPVRYWKPFDDWLTRGRGQIVLPWYKSYNQVKHDRDANFHEASLENLITSVAALHICLQTAFGNEVFFHQPMPGMFSVSGLPEAFLLFQTKP